MKDIDRACILVHGVDNPVLGTAANTKEVSAEGSACEGEIAPDQRRFSEIDRNNSIEPINLLEGEVFAVIPQRGNEFVDLVESDWIDAKSERHGSLWPAAAVNAYKSLLEGLGIVIDALAGFDAGLSLPQRMQ
jgi:hypothetical protein